MRPYPPSWCFSNFCCSKASSFIKSILFGSTSHSFSLWDPRFATEIHLLPWFKAHVFWLHLAPFCRPDFLLVTIPYCFDRNPMRFPVRSSSVPLFSEVLRSFVFSCGATILFSGSHNPLPCFYPLVLGVCYCSWFRQCFGAEFSPWFLGQSAGRVETNPLVLDGIFMGLYIYVHQPRICIFFAGYLADWPW